MADIAVVEDVWGAPFEQLASRWATERRPDAWRSDESVVAALNGARAIVVRNRTRVTRQLLESAPDLVAVARAGVGLDNIDLRAADELGVVVVSPRGANSTSVAEHSLALALALARRVVPLDRAVRAGQWQRLPGRELAGRTWGILGAGATGLAVARLAAALGMDVVAHDPHADPPAVAAAGVALMPLDDLLAAADVLSIHVPATPETRGMVNAGFLAGVKPGALLINVGRGEVIDEQALADALESGHLGGAGLDVRSNEPPLPGRLERLDSVVLTPHVAGITAESQTRIAAVLAEDLDRLLSGQPARNAVGRHATPARGQPAV